MAPKRGILELKKRRAFSIVTNDTTLWGACLQVHHTVRGLGYYARFGLYCRDVHDD